MPIRPPVLDDRRFDDLVEELLSRIPAHTPEWTHPNLGDPGRTLLELFAWLTDTLLYRANLVPERQRLVFLKLLGQPLRAALPARGLASVSLADRNATAAIALRPRAAFTGPLPYEASGEITVLPVVAEGFYKRPQTLDAALELDLKSAYDLDYDARVTPYSTTPVFPGGAATPGFDLVRDTQDKSVWLALLAARAETVTATRAALRRPAAQRRCRAQRRAARFRRRPADPPPARARVGNQHRARQRRRIGLPDARRGQRRQRRAHPARRDPPAPACGERPRRAAERRPRARSRRSRRPPAAPR